MSDNKQTMQSLAAENEQYEELISLLKKENKILQHKADKYDAFDKKMEGFYAEDSDADLLTIGEAAAIAFGYLD